MKGVAAQRDLELRPKDDQPLAGTGPQIQR